MKGWLLGSIFFFMGFSSVVEASPTYWSLTGESGGMIQLHSQGELTRNNAYINFKGFTTLFFPGGYAGNVRVKVWTQNFLTRAGKSRYGEYHVANEQRDGSKPFSVNLGIEENLYCRTPGVATIRIGGSLTFDNNEVSVLVESRTDRNLADLGVEQEEPRIKKRSTLKRFHSFIRRHAPI